MRSYPAFKGKIISPPPSSPPSSSPSSSHRHHHHHHHRHHHRHHHHQHRFKKKSWIKIDKLILIWIKGDYLCHNDHTSWFEEASGNRIKTLVYHHHHHHHHHHHQHRFQKIKHLGFFSRGLKKLLETEFKFWFQVGRSKFHFPGIISRGDYFGRLSRAILLFHFQPLVTSRLSASDENPTTFRMFQSKQKLWFQ